MVSDLRYKPVESDGRPNVVTAPMTQGNFLWICGRGDNKSTGVRGGGNKFVVDSLTGVHIDTITYISQGSKIFGFLGDKTAEFTSSVEHIKVVGSATGNDGEYTITNVEYNDVALRTEVTVVEDIPSGTIAGSVHHANTAEVSIEFIDCVEIQDGQLTWNPDDWGIDDEFTFCIAFPATPLSSNPGAGNCDIDPTYGWLVPSADSTGDYDMDGTTCVPIPNSWVPGSPGGFWDYAIDKWDGDIIANPEPYAGSIHLFPAEIAPARFMKSVSFNHPLGVHDVDVTKTEFIHKNWLLKVVVNRMSTGTGSCAAWLQLYRKTTT